MIGMVDNATIRFLQETGGGFDAKGNPIAKTKTKTAAVRCNVNVARKEYAVVSYGQVRMAKYIVTVDLHAYLSLSIDSFTEIELVGEGGMQLGIHQANDIQYLKYVNRLKIVV